MCIYIYIICILAVLACYATLKTKKIINLYITSTLNLKIICINKVYICDFIRDKVHCGIEYLIF